MRITNIPLVENTLPVTVAQPQMNRRLFLQASTQLALGLLLPGFVLASNTREKKINFYHTHTGERLTVNYLSDSYRGGIQSALEYFLRDFRTGEVHSIDPDLLDTLYLLQTCCGSSGTYEVISGYRSLQTNELLRRRGTGVNKNSLHMKGQAIDIRLSDRSTRVLRDIAAELHNGGVGYYPRSDFIHIDTGEKKQW